VAVQSKAWVSRDENVGSNPTGGMAVCVECSALPSRVLCDRLITRPEESY
jgi:hypothetical protein